MNDNKDQKDLEIDLEHVKEDLFEERELEDLEENSKDKIKKLKQKLQECEKEKMEHLENLQRAKAEFLNGKRRLEEEKIQDRERTVISHIEKLLPLCDSFYMAQSDTSAWEAIDPTWRKGIEGIFTQFQSLLQSYGVKELNPQGETFNPELHEAMTNIPVTDKEKSGKVISVIQKGFIKTGGNKEYLIRPARVTVGEYTE